jgi:hypothetical protein
MPPPPGTPPEPSSDIHRTQSFKITNLPSGYEYKHAALLGAQFFNLETYAEDSEHNEHFIAALRNDEGTSTG